MKPSYAIGAKNGLLDQKHLDALDKAIWLYLWFLDKQPKNSDKVRGGQPITYDMFNQSFPEVPKRTYFYWLRRVEQGGYISLLRTPKGSVITINKPKKWADGSATNGTENDKPVQPIAQVVQPIAPTSAKFGTSNIKETIIETIETSNTTNVVLGDHKKEISKLYYQAIKTLDLPVTNHNTIKAKINELASNPDKLKIINYLTFIRDKYTETQWAYKPNLNTALDIFSKRSAIRNTFERAIKDQGESKVAIIS